MQRLHLMIVMAFAALAPAAPAAAQSWEPTVRIETYAIEGRTGYELYQSIGENGPTVGIGRAVAYTTFDLKWSRDYRPENGGCRLASAKPWLTIIYKLPKPSGQLPPQTRAAWRRFTDGIEAHERVHGQYIVEMVRKIQDYSVGLTTTGDPDCRKIRQVLTQRLGELSQEQRARGREFDRLEMSASGNVHRLVLDLVNG